MSVRKHVGKKYNVESKVYSILCPREVKNTITSFFTETKDYEKKTTPILLNGVRLFSIYQFTHGTERVSMIMVTRYGATFLEKHCGDLLDDHEMTIHLSKFFGNLLKDDPEANSAFGRMIPAIVAHYDAKRLTPTSPYIPGEMNEKYLCIFYPIPDEKIKGLKIVLQNDHPELQQEIRREQIRLG